MFLTAPRAGWERVGCVGLKGIGFRVKKRRSGGGGNSSWDSVSGGNSVRLKTLWGLCGMSRGCGSRDWRVWETGVPVKMWLK